MTTTTKEILTNGPHPEGQMAGVTVVRVGENQMQLCVREKDAQRSDDLIVTLARNFDPNWERRHWRIRRQGDEGMEGHDEYETCERDKKRVHVMLDADETDTLDKDAHDLNDRIESLMSEAQSFVDGLPDELKPYADWQIENSERGIDGIDADDMRKHNKAIPKTIIDLVCSLDRYQD